MNNRAILILCLLGLFVGPAAGATLDEIYKEALRANQAGDLKAAITPTLRYYEAAKKQSPGMHLGNAAYWLGTIYSLEGDPEKGIEFLEEAVSELHRAPEDGAKRRFFDATKNLCAMYSQAGRLDEIEEVLTEKCRVTDFPKRTSEQFCYYRVWYTNARWDRC